jgi:hypothetical protein
VQPWEASHFLSYLLFMKCKLFTTNVEVPINVEIVPEYVTRRQSRPHNLYLRRTLTRNSSPNAVMDCRSGILYSL